MIRKTQTCLEQMLQVFLDNFHACNQGLVGNNPNANCFVALQTFDDLENFFWPQHSFRLVRIPQQ